MICIPLARHSTIFLICLTWSLYPRFSHCQRYLKTQLSKRLWFWRHNSLKTENKQFSFQKPKSYFLRIYLDFWESRTEISQDLTDHIQWICWSLQFATYNCICLLQFTRFSRWWKSYLIALINSLLSKRNAVTLRKWTIVN